ncbi:MAG: lysophospholipid acyltransferase family protein [Candidatus Omnitrophota bacterium]
MKKILRGVFERLESGVVAVCIGMTHWIDPWIACKIAEAFGALAFFFMRKRRRIALENIGRAFGERLSDPEKVILARKSFESVALSILELFFVRRTRLNYQHIFHINGLEYMDQALQEGQGVVLVISHLGSWEYSGFLGLFTKADRYVIVKNFRNPRVTRQINELRLVIPTHPIPKDDPGALREVLRQLRRNNIVAVLIDQWSGPSGLWVPFFGQETSTTSLPAKIAARSNSPIVFASCIRASFGRYEIYFEPAFHVDLQDPNWEYNTTLALNKTLERKVREVPSQWIWGHRRWKAKPAGMK